MLTIEIQDSAHYRESITINKILYSFRFDYYPRTDSWYMSLSDSQNTALATGRMLTTGWNPLVRDQDDRLPAGAFYVSSLVDPLGRDAFLTNKASLVFFSPEEVDELAANAGTPETITIEAL